MRLLEIILLGGFQARLASGSPLALPGRKIHALLGYLALRPGVAHPRDKLATLLWPDASDGRARHSLRQLLLELRRALAHVAAACVLETGGTVALDAEAVAVDVPRFERLVAEGSPESLAQAAALYGGDLLEGVGVGESPFEEWLLSERERLHELALEALARLLAHQSGTGALDAAVQTAVRLLALDPLQEAVHRAQMRLFMRQGRRAAALRQYQDCVGWLQRELGAEPEAETRELYLQLLRAAGSGEARRPGAEPAASAGGAAGQRPTESALVGRAAELRALAQALERTLDAGSLAVAVSGEAGIGKTRLLQEFLAEARHRDVRILSAWCYETERSLPFRPWVDALRAQQPALDPTVTARLGSAVRASLARVFPELARPDDPETESDEHGLLFEAMGELVKLVALDGPIVVVLEDLHWADAMSARLLAFLGRRLGPLPVLIVGSTRPEDAVDAPVLAQALGELRAEDRLLAINLGPLSRDDTLALARALRRGSEAGLVDRIADDLWAVSEGNPFVIVETVRALDQGSAAREGRGPLIAESVRDSVARRLASLSDTARRAVEVAAVVGRSFPFRLLHAASDLGELEAAAAVEELVRRRLLDTVDEDLAFCHDRIRQVAYEGVLPARRTLLHRAVARAIESRPEGRLDEVADELGHHFLRAGEVEKALGYLERFAEIATRRYALDAALGALRLAAEAAERLPDPARDRRRLDVVLRQAFVLGVGGRHRECLGLLRASAPLQGRVGDPAQTADYLYRLALASFYLGDYDETRLAGEAALRASEATGDEERIGKALHTLALLSLAAGEGRRAADYCTRAVPLLDRPSSQRRLASVYWVLALDRIYAGRFDAALERVRQSMAVAEAVGDPKLRSLAGGLESWVYVARGDGPAAVECAERALAAAEGSVPTSLALRWVGYAHLHHGDAGTAIRVLEQACRQIERFPVRHTYVESLAFLAEAYVRGGDPARGMTAACRAIDLARAERSPFNVGLAERAAGRAARATGAEADGEAHLSRALEAFLSNDAAFEAGMTRLDLARALAARGEAEGARAQLRAAVRELSETGAPRRVAEAQELARSLGLGVVEPG
jgi:DNA-binding SARP family transcriptional activator/tetratricopeptide (TPR) repeat protein